MNFAEEYKTALQETIAQIDTAGVGQAIEWFEEARAQSKHIFVCGNGGSASTASHFACDIVKGASFNRESRFRIMALTDSLPTLTAYSNDVSYECVFVEQLKNFAQPGDLVVCISGSGNSPNVLRAAEYAAFLEATQLHRTRPDARLECSRLGRYDEIMSHIIGHRYFLSKEQHRDVSLQEAAASWYDNVYHPIAQAIRKHDVLKQLPGWTEADLYVEITRRWLALSEEGEPAGPDPAIQALLAQHARTWWQRRRKIRLPE